MLSRNKSGNLSNKSFVTDDDTGSGAGGVAQPSDTGAGYAGKPGYCKIVMHGENYVYEPGDFLYTEGEPTVGGKAYYNVDLSSFETISEVGEDYIVAGDDKYYLVSKSAEAFDYIDGLERFEGQSIVAVVDGSRYKDMFVENGRVYLPFTASNVLVGLPYRGIIETIPGEIRYSSGNSTVGVNRRIVDGVLYYYRTRGLWYGKDLNKLYEIKPYTQENFAENIPLESGKLVLRVADGFSLESSLFIVQDSPFPALIQSITLGSLYNGKS